MKSKSLWIYISIIVLLLSSYNSAFAIFFSADFKPAQAVQAAFRAINDPITIANKSAVVQKTVQLVKIYKSAKNITGDIVSTWQDIQTFQVNSLNDLKNITGISKEHQQALNEFFSWKETLNGNRGKSLLQINSFYSSVTNEFRDNQGNLNVAQTLYSHVLSDEERYNKTRNWNSFVNTMNETSKLYYDQMFRERIKQSQLLDREAYKESVILNFEIFKSRAKNLVSDINGLTSSDYLNQKRINGLGTLNENEISQRQTNILELQHKSSLHRMEAFKIFNTVKQLENESILYKESLHHQYRAWLLANKKVYNPQNDGLYREFLSQRESWNKPNYSKMY